MHSSIFNRLKKFVNYNVTIFCFIPIDLLLIVYLLIFIIYYVLFIICFLFIIYLLLSYVVYIYYYFVAYIILSIYGKVKSSFLFSFLCCFLVILSTSIY